MTHSPKAAVRKDFAGALWRLGIFSLIGLLGIFALSMTFGQLRFDPQSVYHAEFTDISGLKKGDFVRIAGVEVGKVKHIALRPDTTVDVGFSVNDTVLLTQGTRAVIRFDNVIGDRFLELKEGAGGVERLHAGQTIPVSRTEPAFNLDALIGGFRPLFRALDPVQVNALTEQLIRAFQGQGAAISSFLAQTGAVTHTLADRDELIGQVITNLNTVLASLGDQSTQFGTSITALSELVDSLTARKGDISNAVAYGNAAAGTIADLLTQMRPPLTKVVTQSDRANSIVLADHDYFDDLLNTLPDAYQALARQGLYGDFFTFYLCDAVFKLNGKGGQPVYVKVAGQPSGRCAPR